MQLPIVPAPRAFRASGETCVPSEITLEEQLVPSSTQPEEAYEVEFCDETGATVAEVALRPGQFVVVA